MKTGVRIFIFFLFTVVSKPKDCIFPYDFKESIKEKVKNSLFIPFKHEISICLKREEENAVD